MPTINSFTQIPSPTQIVAYLAVIMGIIVFYACITPNFQNQIANIVLSVLYGVATVILIISTTIASYIDPTDPVV